MLEAHAATNPSCPTPGGVWDVKIGTDPQKGQVNLTSPPTPTTIAQLTSLPLPSPITHRGLPTETTVFVTSAMMRKVYIEHDADTHIAIDDGAGHSMIAELPDITCVPTTSAFYSGIVRAHQQLTAWGGSTPVAARISGVGFFDAYTGQSDQAANQIELHSVLNLNINPGSITGQLTSSAGGAISAASVSDGVDPAVSTDSNGVYTIPNVAASTSYTVTASASNFISQSRSVSVSFGAASAANFALTPSPGALTGVVSNSVGGAAIPGATVTDGGGSSTTTNGSGVYTVSGLAAGNHILTASANGFTSQAQTASVAGGQTTPGINFSLTPTPGALTGTVTSTSGGAPIAGAAVSDRGGANTRTDGSGTYTMAGLTPGIHSLTVTAAGFASQTQTAPVTANQTTSGMNFSLAPALTGTISGTVTGASGGVAVAGATVSDGGGASATTDGSGAYTLAGLAPGSHTLSASATSFTSGSQTTSVTAGTTQNLSFSLMPSPTIGAVTGLVTDPGGAAISGATVSDSGGISTTANGSGVYTLIGLGPGSHALTASTTGFRAQTQTAMVTPGYTTQDVSFSLTPSSNTGSVSGPVISASGGAAISGATISDSGGPSAITTATGSYTLNGLAPGSHTLSASATGFNPATQTVTVTAETAQNLSFSLTPVPTTGAVTGTVTSASGGATIAGAWVSDSGGASTTTNASGVYTLTGLVPGSHTLTATGTGFDTSQPLTASVTADQTTQNVNLSLPPIPPTTDGPKLVQAAGATETTAATSLTATFASVTGAGHLLVLSAGVYTGATNQIASVTDSGGNQWTRIGAFFVAGHFSDGEMWYAPNASASTSVTVHLVAAAVVSLAVQEFSGVATTSPLDGSAATASTSTSPNSGSLTPTAATDLVVGFIAGHGNAQAISVTAAGFTAQPQQTSTSSGSTPASVITGYKVLTFVSAQGFTGSTTAAMYWTAGIAGFKAAPATTGSVTGNVTSASGGGAVSGATVSDSSGGSTTTDSSGVYTLTGLSPGSHTLTAAAAGFTSGVQTALVTAGQTTTGVNFSLPLSSTTGAVSGTVTVSGGTAISGATVTDEAGNSTTTNGSGLYTLIGLAPGSRTLSATATGVYSGTQMASVISGQTTQSVNFSLISSSTTGALTGAVTSSSGGTAISGATVSDSGGASVRTDAMGTYSLAGLAPGSHTLTAATTGFTSQAQTASISAGTTQTFSFSLAPTPTTGAITGIVASAPGGAAISAAIVSDSGRTTTTNASGAYTLTGLSPGSHTLTAAAAGFSAQTQTTLVAAGNTQNVSFSLTPTPTTAAISGTVTSALGSAAISGATVSDSGGASTSTNSSGVYSLTDLAPGTHTLTVGAAGFISLTQAAAVSAGNTQNVSFSLTTSPTTGGVSGTVSSASDGTAVSGATVSDSGGGASAITDGLGAYTLAGLSPGSHTLTASATGFTATTQTASITAGGTTQAVNFSLPPTTATGSVSGTVSSASDGAVVSGATVSDSGGVATTTDSLGAYTLAGLAPGSHTLTATAAGFTSGTQTASVTGDATTPGINFSLTSAPTTGAASGTVTSASNGAAVPGATVSDSGGVTTTTDSLGAYTLTGLVPGSHSLTATATGFSSAMQTVSVIIGATTAGVNFSLAPTPGAVSGTVASASDGTAVPVATVTDSSGASTTTDSLGAYTLTGLAPGSRTLTATATGFSSATQTAPVTGGATTTGVNFILTPTPTTGAVSGTVTSASSGAAVSAATVSDSGGASATTDSSGVYTMTGLAAGSHTLTATATGFSSLSVAASITGGASTTGVNFSLAPLPGAVTGRVTSASNGAVIAGGTVSDSGGASTTTDSSGAYTLPGLASGSHTLTAFASGFTSLTQTALVAAGATTMGVDFTLPPAPGAVSGTVTSASGGAGIAGASVIDSGGLSTTTNGSGSFTLTGLAPGAHTLTASATGFTSGTRTASVTSGTTITGVNFSLSPTPTTGAVTGTVTSASGGAAIAGATVIDGGGASTRTNNSGVYTLTGLTQGSHTLTGTATGFSTSQPQPASVSAGQTTQNINFSLTPIPPAPQLVQAAGATESSATTSLTGTFSAPTAAGHLLVLSASIYTGATNQVTSVTDSGGNTWTRIGAFTVAGHNSDGEMWYAANARAVTSVAIHTTSAAVASLEVQEFSGISTTAPLDRSTGTANTSTSPNSGVVTPTTSFDLAVGFVAGHSNAQTISVGGAGYTAQAQQTSNGGGLVVATVVTGYKVLAAPSAQSFTGNFSSSMYWAAGIVCFKSGT